MATPERNGWWKGTFPQWIVVILLGVIAFASKRYVDGVDKRLDHNEARITRAEKDIALTDKRVVRLETQVEGIKP